ncbi:SGNH/GDSL hydrolase family protein [Rhodococcus triatomae]|nr:SGNH/GDSL hydrolase family protein [Rhodococcus triatomae]QNG25453.1 SGNH/GDSL hydrolase family protein [Rhodococcus triatomae]
MAGSAAASATPDVGPDAAPRSGPAYVALGDSRASGPLIDVASHRDLCLRSTTANYPALLARSLDASSFVDVTCSAAKPEHVIDTAQFVGTRFAPPQLEQLGPDTDLVTISIGGGGSNHLPVTALCVALIPGADAHCRDNALSERLVVDGVERMRPQVDAVVESVVRAAPNARVYLIGHGGSVGHRGCWPNLPMSDADATWLSGYFDRFNDIYVTAAQRHGVEYVDIAKAAIDGGHDACAAREDRWFEGLIPGSPAEPAHPNARAMEAIAQLVADDYARASGS